MKNFLKNLIALAILGSIIYAYQAPIKSSFLQLANTYLPCQIPISYTLGDFDSEFGISEAEFLSAVSEAEGMWEGAIDKELFVYKTDGEMKVNLVYDSRQEATIKLKRVNATLDVSRSNYDLQKENLSSLRSLYEQDKKAFEKKYAEIKNKKNITQEEVDLVNRMQAQLNIKVNEVNQLVNSLNKLAASLNLDVQKFNEIGSSNGEEYEEGLYESGPNGASISIYQFDNRDKLVRVLAHELGHALGIDHVEDSEAVMYRLNKSESLKLTEADIKALSARCEY